MKYANTSISPPLHLHTLTTMQPSTTSASTSQPLLAKPINNVPVKILNPSKLQEQREKGLCYSYDERFVAGHKCKIKFFFMVTQDDILEEPSALKLNTLPDSTDYHSSQTVDTPSSFQHDPATPHIILHASVANNTTETLRIHGIIKTKTLPF